MEKLEKFYLLNILYTHKARQIWFSKILPQVHSLGKNSNSGKGVKMTKLSFLYCCSFFTRASN
jgi:hypothetical protein